MVGSGVCAGQLTHLLPDYPSGPVPICSFPPPKSRGRTLGTAHGERQPRCGSARAGYSPLPGLRKASGDVCGEARSIRGREVLQVPQSQRKWIDLRMSAWIMRKVKVKPRTIVVDEDRVIPFAPEDFHKIFGVPCGNRAVRGRDGEIKSAAVEFMKQTIGMNASPAHNLKAAEDFLSRDISEESSKIEKDCFQISFVIFVMGYVLSPGTKYEHMTIDFWGALANPELISQFNWCEYAVDNLMAAVMKLQMEYHNKAQVVHLSGCHLFFQV